MLNEELGPFQLNKMTSLIYEGKLLNGIVKQLQHVICEVVKPKKLVYIAVDGPPPRAKMVQQRARRYKSIKEDSYIKDLEEKYQIKIPTTPWNKSAISPGTSFMAKLGKILVENIRKKTFQIHNEKITVINVPNILMNPAKYSDCFAKNSCSVITSNCCNLLSATKALLNFSKLLSL